MIINDGKMEKSDEESRPLLVRAPAIKIKDFDAEFDRLIRVVETTITEVDARIMEPVGRGRYEPRHYRNLREFMSSPSVKARVKEALGKGEALRDLNGRLANLREASSMFALGLYEDELSTTSTYFKLQDVVLPTTSSPYAKQQLFADYLDMHRKAFEAATKNPVAKRIVDIIPQFVLGRGVVGVARKPSDQKLWDAFWVHNGMKIRIKQVLRELLIYGEVFLRYFNTKDGLTLRSLDPSTIWDIVTNPDDIEDVLYYHQQYTVINPSPVVGPSSALPSTLIIRQIPAADLDHWKINATSSEKRGRSQLYPILGWLQRFREFANDRVLLNKMRAMFALDVAVDGTAEDVSSVEGQFSSPPGPGAVLVHNKSVEINFKSASTDSNEAKTDAEMILKIIAVGAGVSEQFLGVSSASTRAGALIQTEPDVKNFEAYQEIVEEILTKAASRLYKRTEESLIEFTFPAIASEDRSAKLKDVAFAEAMDYFSKARSAAMVAKEFGVTTYDFDEEQDEIRKERSGEPVMAQGMQQVPKAAPDPTQMPGLGGDMKVQPGGEHPGPLAHQSGEMGFSPTKLSGRGQANTKATLNRPEFTRGGERTKIQTNRTSGTPLRHASAPDGSAVFTQRGWTQSSRDKSLVIRRLKALQRKREEQLQQGRVEEAARSERSVQELREALATLTKTVGQQAPVVNVTLPPPPEVRVEAPQITVEAAHPPSITVSPPNVEVNVAPQPQPQPMTRRVVVHRDPETQLITRAETIEEAVDAEHQSDGGGDDASPDRGPEDPK